MLHRKLTLLLLLIVSLTVATVKGARSQAGVRLNSLTDPEGGEEGEEEEDNDDYQTGIIIIGVWGAFTGIMLIVGISFEMYKVYQKKHPKVETTRL